MLKLKVRKYILFVHSNLWMKIWKKIKWIEKPEKEQTTHETLWRIVSKK